MWRNWVNRMRRLLSSAPKSTQKSDASITSLPNEILLEIFQYLTYWEVNVCLPRICRRFRRIVIEERISRYTRLKMVLPPIAPRYPISDEDHPMIAVSWNGLKRSHFAVHPGLPTLQCRYSKSVGFSCYLNGDTKLSISESADMISPILLEPVMFPPTSRMSVYINPITSPKPTLVSGGKYFEIPWDGVEPNPGGEKLSNCPVTILDLTYCIARRLKEDDPACGGFRLSIPDKRITLRDDRSVDVHVFVHQVKRS